MVNPTDMRRCQTVNERRDFISKSLNPTKYRSRVNLDIVELLDVVGYLSKRYSFEVEVDCYRNYLGILLGMFKANVDDKAIVAAATKVLLNRAALVKSPTILYDIV